MTPQLYNIIRQYSYTTQICREYHIVAISNWLTGGVRINDMYTRNTVPYNYRKISYYENVKNTMWPPYYYIIKHRGNATEYSLPRNW